jgi:hypothetical protein
MTRQDIGHVLARVGARETCWRIRLDDTSTRAVERSYARAVSEPPLAYLAAWASFCLLAVGIILYDRKAIVPEWRKYVAFISVRWKLMLFAPALIFVTFAGRFTDDETWDVVTGGGMSILTYLTAPWSIGLFYQALKGRRPRRHLIVALALCLFASSWFYDGYLLWRDGQYTERWLGNLMLSPTIYASAGVLWNLEARRPGGGFTLSFLRSNWPEPPVDSRFRPLALICIPLILIAAFLLVAYVGWHF